MVILWTQLDGGNQDPSEKLDAQEPEPSSKVLSLTSTPGKSGLQHPKVDGLPPTGRRSKSASCSPKSSKRKKSKVLRNEVSPPKDIASSSSKDIASEKCVVSIRQVPFPKGKTSPSSDLNVSPASEDCSLDKSTSVAVVENVVDTRNLPVVSCETPLRMTISKNGTLKGDTIQGPAFSGRSSNSINENLEQNDIEYKKKNKKKFYTLPRNWKSQAVDIFKKGKTFCELCKKKCSGEVLRVHEKYFHITCFNCSSCKNSLAQGGFFSRDSNFYCTDCYQSQFGQLCASCGKYVEGEVVSALGNTYHQKCFLCARCRQPFPSGERVTYTGKECLCQRCYNIPTVDSESPTRSPSSVGPKCSGCKDELVEGQALIALDQQWHIWCFKCSACNTLLHGEYMGKDGLPYCEKDYQSQFGVKCAYCDRFITGKVLQAGDNHHFHPTCARCTKCGDPFGDGEEMYLQGTAIWHPRCGPGPTENGTVINGSLSNGHHVNGEQKPSDREKDFDGLSSTASETQFSRSRTPSINGSFRSYSPYNSLNRKFSGPYRTCSPGLILREYKSSQSPVDITRIYTYSYLAAEPTQSYLRRPIDPYDKPPKSPHFHRPLPDTRKLSMPKTSSRLGMRVLVDSIHSETPRPKSPKMNNEEPIILSHFPAAKPPIEGQTPRIERDDFPAPPYPYTDPERRRRWSGSSKGVSLDETDDGIDEDEVPPLDPKLKKEEAELSKITTGIGKVFLQQVKEREKIRAWKATHIDPRNASRTPSANKEPGYRMRYESSVNALVSSLRQPPKPGYGFSPRTTYSRQGMGSYPALPGDYAFNAMGEKTHSTDFNSARSDVSASSLTEADRTALNAELCPSATYSSGLRGYSYSPHFRRSLPNMHHMASDPPKIYPAHLLFTTNYRLPNDVDRCHLERHLSDADFEMVFRMTRIEFYRLPEWKRNDIKRRSRFF